MLPAPENHFPVSIPPLQAATMGAGKRNTEIKKIENKSARFVCFSNTEIKKISGSHIAVLVFSPTGRSYVHGSPSFDPIVDHFLQSSTTVASMMTMTTTSTAQFLHSSTAASMMTMTTTTGTSRSAASVSDSASTEVGLKEQVEAMNVEGCNNLEELLEMKRKLDEIRETVLCSFADSLISWV